MEIKNHTNANYFVVTNPTTEATAEAKKLTGGNWAKITTGGIIVHKNFRQQFEKLARIETRNTTIAPSFETMQEKEDWLSANFNSPKAADFYSIDRGVTTKIFNQKYAGKTISELEKYALED